MNIHLPAILGFTRYQGFDPSPDEHHPQMNIPELQDFTDFTPNPIFSSQF